MFSPLQVFILRPESSTSNLLTFVASIAYPCLSTCVPRTVQSRQLSSAPRPPAESQIQKKSFLLLARWGKFSWDNLDCHPPHNSAQSNQVIGMGSGIELPHGFKVICPESCLPESILSDWTFSCQHHGLRFLWNLISSVKRADREWGGGALILWGFCHYGVVHIVESIYIGYII